MPCRTTLVDRSVPVLVPVSSVQRGRNRGIRVLSAGIVHAPAVVGGLARDWRTKADQFCLIQQVACLERKIVCMSLAGPCIRPRSRPLFAASGSTIAIGDQLVPHPVCRRPTRANKSHPLDRRVGQRRFGGPLDRSVVGRQARATRRTSVLAMSHWSTLCSHGRDLETIQPVPDGLIHLFGAL